MFCVSNSFAGAGGFSCERFIRHRPPGTHPRVRLAFPPQGSVWHQFDIDLTSISWFDHLDAKSTPEEGGWGGFEGGVWGPVPNKPLTTLQCMTIEWSVQRKFLFQVVWTHCSREKKQIHNKQSTIVENHSALLEKDSYHKMPHVCLEKPSGLQCRVQSKTTPKEKMPICSFCKIQPHTQIHKQTHETTTETHTRQKSKRAKDR